MSFNYLFHNSKVGDSSIISSQNGIFNLNKQLITNIPPGQDLFDTPGTTSWLCPAGVTSVCVVCIGGGGGGMIYNQNSSTNSFAMNGGTGGGLGWKNNIAVVPGTSYTVVVGAGGLGGYYSTGSTNGGTSYFISDSLVAGQGGQAGRYNTSRSGGLYAGDGGGEGGDVFNSSSSGAGPCGGGGAGGYSGKGGTSNNFGIQSNASGGAGQCGDASSNRTSGGGGGVGVYGEGSTGVTAGEGGSGGTNGTFSEGVGLSDLVGGLYGGGGGGSAGTYWGNDITKLNGGKGAVRIIWGFGRAFPSTLTGDL